MGNISRSLRSQVRRRGTIGIEPGYSSWDSQSKRDFEWRFRQCFPRSCKGNKSSAISQGRKYANRGLSPRQAHRFLRNRWRKCWLARHQQIGQGLVCPKSRVPIDWNALGMKDEVSLYLCAWIHSWSDTETIGAVKDHSIEKIRLPCSIHARDWDYSDWAFHWFDEFDGIVIDFELWKDGGYLRMRRNLLLWVLVLRIMRGMASSLYNEVVLSLSVFVILSVLGYLSFYKQVIFWFNYDLENSKFKQQQHNR